MTNSEYWAAQLEAHVGRLVEIHLVKDGAHTGVKGRVERLDGGAWALHSDREVAMIPIGQNPAGQIVSRPAVAPETRVVFSPDSILSLVARLETEEEAREKLIAAGIDVPSEDGPPGGGRIVAPQQRLFVPQR